MQWYGREHIDEKGVEDEETIDGPLPRGWSLWCQADVIAKTIRDRGGEPSLGKEGVVIGKDENLRVLRWLDDAREKAGIKYDRSWRLYESIGNSRLGRIVLSIKSSSLLNREKYVRSVCSLGVSLQPCKWHPKHFDPRSRVPLLSCHPH